MSQGFGPSRGRERVLRPDRQKGARVSSLLQNEGVALFWRPVAISKLFQSWAGERDNQTQFVPSGQGWKGLQESSASPAGRTALRREQGGDQAQTRRSRAGKTGPSREQVPFCLPAAASPAAPCSRAQSLLGATGLGGPSEHGGSSGPTAARGRRGGGCAAHAGLRGRDGSGASAKLTEGGEPGVPRAEERLPTSCSGAETPRALGTPRPGTAGGGRGEGGSRRSRRSPLVPVRPAPPVARRVNGICTLEV